MFRSHDIFAAEAILICKEEENGICTASFPTHSFPNFSPYLVDMHIGTPTGLEKKGNRGTGKSYTGGQVKI